MLSGAWSANTTLMRSCGDLIVPCTTAVISCASFLLTAGAIPSRFWMEMIGNGPPGDLRGRTGDDSCRHRGSELPPERQAVAAERHCRDPGFPLALATVARHVIQ